MKPLAEIIKLAAKAQLLKMLHLFLFQVVEMLVAVIVIFILSWTPILLFDFFVAIGKIFKRAPGSSSTVHTARLWLELLSYVNSTVNAFIYYLTSQ